VKAVKVILPTLSEICNRHRRLFDGYDSGEGHAIYEGVATVSVELKGGEPRLQAQLRFSDLSHYGEREILDIVCSFASLVAELKKRESDIIKEAKTLL
jgi:hypothetical protein